MDQRGVSNIQNDTKLLKGIWKLLDEADIIITQNGKRFDEKKLNARFILSGMKPPSTFKHIDTKQIASRHFAFTSNRLEYLSEKLCATKKLKHHKFPGHLLWVECLKGNVKAFQEMERYNKHDVIALEELYLKLAPWTPLPNHNLYRTGLDNICSACQSANLVKNGFRFTSSGKYQRFTCYDCGAEVRGNQNLLDKNKRKALHK
jgi:DNA polymerase elongation subunit (family B)